jgi:hypothetical protein
MKTKHWLRSRRIIPLRWSGLSGRVSALGAVALWALCYPQLSQATFCSAQTDASIFYCEDFSAANPLGSYTVSNPWHGSIPFTAIGVNTGTLAWANNPDGLASAMVNYNTPMAFEDTILEADVRFDTTDPQLRSFMGIQWFLGPTSSDFQNRIVWGLQLDEHRAYLDLNVAGGIQVHTSRSLASLVPGKTYRLRLDVGGDRRIRGYVDGSLLLDESYDFSGLPRLLNPGLVGNSYEYSAETQRYDNVLARIVPEPSTGILLAIGIPMLLAGKLFAAKKSPGSKQNL